MTRMFYGAAGCQGVTSGLTGQQYDTDRKGFINVESPADAAFFKKNGYVEAGATRTRTGKYWVCDECAWDSNINHCRWCDSEDLRKVEA